MTTWYPNHWYGSFPAGTGTGTPTTILNVRDLVKPLHTRIMEVLEREMPDVNVWADADLNEDASDRVVVENSGGEWDNAFASTQRRSRTLTIWTVSQTSDGAERLLDKVTYIIRRVRNEMRLIRMDDIKGGYNIELEVYTRGVTAQFHGR